MKEGAMPFSADLSDVNLPIYPRSVTEANGVTLFLAQTVAGKRLAALASDGAALAAFEGESFCRGGKTLLLCALTPVNARALREAVPALKPRPFALRSTAGCGDRLGLATPGHARAARAVPGFGMIYAQQSVRELVRTNRTAAEVLDDATWGAFQEGWLEGVGGDADHLKTPDDIEQYAGPGFSFYTVDPGSHVDGAADTDDEAALRAKFAALPWPALATTARDLANAYLSKRIEVEDRAFVLDEQTLLRAAAKYGRAVAHVAIMYRALCARLAEGAWELEVSVDETDTPTTHAEHLFIARELRRLGVKWVSLAPRYVGRFEKGVDYIGDLAQFTADFAGHAAIARALGPYKLSLHSGSDKFSVYSIAAEATRGLVHLKTAGTSYLEALRVLASTDPAFFREILQFAIDRYETDKASYHVSATLDKVPRPETLRDEELPGLLEQFDSREALHVTFGSVLTSERGFKARLLGNLVANEERYYDALERHFIRHLAPLSGRG
jgi:tagaturonate epimerase